ncbi:hypothetical protein MKK67_17660 [Methylobacterium sp. J-072]|uniref:hypothetical protein n=1 Tax=Methylobacterium sp. J-072 TaxID=2836651 RepID=UPI001FB9C01B|nr:hypothetical protein [Methylobacterium sp. J-072]MCJ2094305.1 hypothetical protein [Methylobacterium sp. J-072]
MPSHACIDPHDQYAQEEVLVVFETTAGVVKLISAHDAWDDDILPELEAVQRQALEREILDDYPQEIRYSRVGPARVRSRIDRQQDQHERPG